MSGAAPRAERTLRGAASCLLARAPASFRNHHNPYGDRIMRPAPTTDLDVPYVPLECVPAQAGTGASGVGVAPTTKRAMTMAEAILLVRLLTRRVRMEVLRLGEN
jgi:hypothetical protein